mgnify:CR=1 FL=1
MTNQRTTDSFATLADRYPLPMSTGVFTLTKRVSSVVIGRVTGLRSVRFITGVSLSEAGLDN